MTGSEDEEKALMNHPSYTTEPLDTDSNSIHSFASSSTLTSSPTHPFTSNNHHASSSTSSSSAQQEKYPSHPSSPPILQPHDIPWQKTPLTIRGLSHLLLRPILPSFLFSPPSHRKIHATSYLDGLRGLAALIVFVDHFVLNWYYRLRNGYLSSPTDDHILQLPLLRLVFAGRASVGIFFVLSGFVLSHKSLSYIHLNDQKSVLNTLASSVFRRGFRLYVPIVVGTFGSAIMASKGWFTPVPSRGEMLPPMLPSWAEQYVHWKSEIAAMIFPWGTSDVNRPGGPGVVYNGHLWTIGTEWAGSMGVFMLVLLGSGLKTGWRLMFVGAMAWWGLAVGRWDLWLFFGGVVLAELSIISAGGGEEKLPSFERDEGYGSDVNHFGAENAYANGTTLSITGCVAKLMVVMSRILRPLKTFFPILNWLLLLLSLFLLSYAGESSSPGLYHTFLVPYTPAVWEPLTLGKEHFWLAIGSLLLVFCINNERRMQKVFEMRLLQYLGDVSYSLYIVHGMVLFTLGTGLQERWTGQVGKMEWVDNGAGELVETIVRSDLDESRYLKAFIACVLINGVVVFWAADLFWRVVDRNSVRLGRRIERCVGRRR